MEKKKEPPANKRGGSNWQVGVPRVEKSNAIKSQQYYGGKKLAKSDTHLRFAGGVNSTLENDTDQRLGRPLWQPDDTADICPLCAKFFSFTRRKHHCRVCGRVVCKECSQHRVALPHMGYDGKQRVCRHCIHRVLDMQKKENAKTLKDEQKNTSRKSRPVSEVQILFMKRNMFVAPPLTAFYRVVMKTAPPLPIEIGEKQRSSSFPDVANASSSSRSKEEILQIKSSSSTFRGLESILTPQPASFLLSRSHSDGEQPKIPDTVDDEDDLYDRPSQVQASHGDKMMESLRAIMSDMENSADQDQEEDDIYKDTLTAPPLNAGTRATKQSSNQKKSGAKSVMLFSPAEQKVNDGHLKKHVSSNVYSYILEEQNEVKRSSSEKVVDERLRIANAVMQKKSSTSDLLTPTSPRYPAPPPPAAGAQLSASSSSSDSGQISSATATSSEEDLSDHYFDAEFDRTRVTVWTSRDFIKMFYRMSEVEKRDRQSRNLPSNNRKIKALRQSDDFASQLFEEDDSEKSLLVRQLKVDNVLAVRPSKADDKICIIIAFEMQRQQLPQDGATKIAGCGRKEKRIPVKFSSVDQCDKFATNLLRLLKETNPLYSKGQKILVLIDPRLGNGQILEYWKNLQSIFVLGGIKCEYFNVTRPKQTFEYVKDPSNKFHSIVCLGPDSIVHEVHAGLYARKPDFLHNVSVCSIPYDGSNGIATSIQGGQCDSVSMAFAIAKGFRRPLDLMVTKYLNKSKLPTGLDGSLYRYASNFITWGSMTDVNRDSSALKFLGDTRFAIMGLLKMADYKTFRAKISYIPASDQHLCFCMGEGCLGCDLELDDPVIEHPFNSNSSEENEWVTLPETEFVQMCACNVSWVGSNVRFAPYAHLSDGYIDLITVKKCPRSRMIDLFMSLSAGTCVNQSSTQYPELGYVKVLAFKVEPLDEVSTKICIDGICDLLGSPLECRVWPRASVVG